MKVIKVGQTTNASLDARDQNNQPMTLDSTYTVTWSATDPTKVSFGPIAANGSCVITGVASTSGGYVGINAAITGGSLPTGTTLNAVSSNLEVDPATPLLTQAYTVLT